MISVILTILLVVFMIIQICWERLSPFFWIFLFLLTVSITVKVIKQCKKYGTKNVFRMKLKTKPIHMEDYVYMMLEKQDEPHSIQKLENSIFYLDKSDISIFTCFSEKGMITGNSKDEFLLCSSGKHQEKVKNPLLSIAEKVEMVSHMDVYINSYLIVDNHCQFLVDRNEINVLFLKNVYYSMMKQHREKKYTEEQFLIYKKQLEKLMSNNVNKNGIA